MNNICIPQNPRNLFVTFVEFKWLLLAAVKYPPLKASQGQRRLKKAQLCYNNKRAAAGTLGELFDYFTDVRLPAPFMTTIRISQTATWKRKVQIPKCFCVCNTKAWTCVCVRAWMFESWPSSGWDRRQKHWRRWWWSPLCHRGSPSAAVSGPGCHPAFWLTASPGRWESGGPVPPISAGLRQSQSGAELHINVCIRGHSS